MKVLAGFLLAVIIPGACSYGIYVDFESISAAILAFFHVSSTALLLGGQSEMLNKIINLVHFKK